MKTVACFIFLFFSIQVWALDCRPPEKYYGEHYLGYLALSEREAEPILMWWRDEFDHQEFEHDPRYSGFEVLSEKRMFREASKILKKKKADIYLLAWPDTIYINAESIDVTTVSLAISKTEPSHNVAYKESVIEPKSRQQDKKIVTESYELGCAANLLQ